MLVQLAKLLNNLVNLKLINNMPIERWAFIFVFIDNDNSVIIFKGELYEQKNLILTTFSFFAFGFL